jgi:CheY-like chemotaxis protein
VKKLIVVEDDIITQKFYSIFFNKNGYQTLITDDGDKVFDSLINEDIGLILMDINLSNTYLNGEKIDGIQLSKYIKTNKKFLNVPLVLVTAYSLSNQIKQLLFDSKAEDIITKPILDYNLFLNKINSLIAS